MHRRLTKRVMSYLIIAIMLTGCGRSKVDVPELKQPVAINDSYRPVERGNVGNSTMLYGVVVPEETCYFWKTSAVVAEILVSPGDYVTEGQVLAYADIEEAQKEVDSLNEQISYFNSLKEATNNKYGARLKELGYQLQSYTETGDTDGINSTNAEISICQENNTFDIKLIDLKISQISKKVVEQQELINDGSLIARSDGRVSFTADVSKTSGVTKTENIVVVADYDNCYIELIGKTVEDDLFEDYNYITTRSGNMVYDLVPYDYGTNEMVVIQARQTYPNYRLRFEDESEMPEAGSFVPVFLQDKLVRDVLTVGNESVYEDNQGSFVYVKTENENVIRYIEIGESDNNNTEVISGLSEGELVYYTSNAIVPSINEVIEAESESYIRQGTTASYEENNTREVGYSSDWEGLVVETMFSDGDDVEKGDVICKIKTNEGNAQITEAANAVNNENLNYNQSISELDNSIAEVNQQIIDYNLAVNTQIISTSSDSELEIIPYGVEILNSKLDQLKAEKNICTINHNYNFKVLQDYYNEISADNTNGTISVRAKQAGTITYQYAVVDDNIKVGDIMFSIKVPSGTTLKVRTTSEMYLNQEVSFENKDNGDIITGRVVGRSGTQISNEQKYYVTTLDDDVFMTSNFSLNNSEVYYIAMDDDSFYEDDSAYTAYYPVQAIDNVYVLPMDTVYSENDSNNGGIKYYIWKMVDDMYVKTYVTTAGEAYNGEICVIDGVADGDMIVSDTTTEEVED